MSCKVSTSQYDRQMSVGARIGRCCRVPRDAVEALGGAEARLLPHVAPRYGGRGLLVALGGFAAVPRVVPTSASGSPYISERIAPRGGLGFIILLLAVRPISQRDLLYNIWRELILLFSLPLGCELRQGLVGAPPALSLASPSVGSESPSEEALRRAVAGGTAPRDLLPRIMYSRAWFFGAEYLLLSM